jgi:hypothetical protein
MTTEHDSTRRAPAVVENPELEQAVRPEEVAASTQRALHQGTAGGAGTAGGPPSGNGGASSGPPPLPRRQVLALQRSVGNRAVGTMMRAKSAPAPAAGAAVVQRDDERDGGVAVDDPVAGVDLQSPGQQTAPPVAPPPPASDGGTPNDATDLPSNEHTGNGSGGGGGGGADAGVPNGGGNGGGDGGGASLPGGVDLDDAPDGGLRQVANETGADLSGGTGGSGGSGGNRGNDGGGGSGGSGGGLPTGTNNPPTLQNPSPGMDWSGFFEAFGDRKNQIRLGLELTRPIPLVGIFTGMGADVINTVQDMEGIEKQEAPFTKTVVVLRDGLMIINNVIGGCAALDEYIQDAATGSVVGAEVDVVTAPLATSLKTVKSYVDVVQVTLDVVIAAAAEYNASHATDAEGLKAWNGLLTNYEANIAGDAITTVLDAVDAGTLGFGNIEVLKEFGQFIKTIFSSKNAFINAFKSIAMGWFGVVGGNMPIFPGSSGNLPQGGGNAPATPGAPAPAPVQMLGEDTPLQLLTAEQQAAIVARNLFADGVLAELSQVRAAWTIGDTILTDVSTQGGQLMDQLRAMGTELTGGVDPFIAMRDGAAQGLQKMHDQVAALTQLGPLGTSAKEKTETLIGWTDEALAAIDSITIPDIHVPRMDDEEFGSSLVNAGSDFADEILQAALNRARMMVAGIKADAREPLVAIRGNAEEVAEFSQLLIEHSTAAINVFNDKIADFTAKLARVQNFEQLGGLLLQQVTSAIMGGEGITIEDLKAGWNEVPELIDQVEAWARGLKRPTTGGGGPVQREVEAGPQLAALPPAPPDDPTESAAPAFA